MGKPYPPHRISEMCWTFAGQAARPIMTRTTTLLQVLALSLLLTGCADFRLQGMVVEGSVPGLAIYDKDDDQLSQSGKFGLDQAIVEVTIDPDTGERQRLDPVRTDSAGRFSVPLDVFAPGMLEYEVGLLIHRPGFRPHWQVIQLPDDDERVVVTLEPGSGASRLEIDLLRDTLRPLP